MPYVIYIAGYGRSGSTLLEIALSQEENSAPVGELVRLDLFGGKNTYCTCGKRIADCEYWRSSYPNLFTQKYVPSSLRNFFKVGLLQRHETVKRISEIKFESSKNPLVFVDSSKSTFFSWGRPFAYRHYGFDVLIINNKRSVKEVLRSLSKGSNSYLGANKNLSNGNVAWKLKLVAQRALLPWRAFNLLVFGYIVPRVYQFYFSRSVIDLSFDDFCRDPIKHIQRIESCLGISLENAKAKIKEKDGLIIKHSIAGNRFRENQCGNTISILKK